jgi:hypothetical protein
MILGRIREIINSVRRALPAEAFSHEESDDSGFAEEDGGHQDS